ATAERVRAIRGALARQAAHVSESVARSGIPQTEHPACPRNSICFQHSVQKLWTSTTIVPHPAQRGGSTKSSAHRVHVRSTLRAPVTIIGILSRGRAHRTSAAVPQLFDMKLRALRRDRAARIGPELFLFERAF